MVKRLISVIKQFLHYHVNQEEEWEIIFIIPGSNQSDANYGYTAGVAECLLQSHAGEISLLPALPPSWKDGSVTGLRARGGFEVSIEWKDGKLTKAEIKSLLGNPCVVRANGKTTNYTPAKGETIVIQGT